MNETSTLWQQTLAQFRDGTGSTLPTPGSGAAATVAACLGVALILKGLKLSQQRQPVTRHADLITVGERLQEALSTCADADVQAGALDTGLVERKLDMLAASGVPDAVLAVAAIAPLVPATSSHDPWSRLTGWRHGGPTTIHRALDIAGVGLRDLGERRLRDVPGANRIYQLEIDGLPHAFPPLETLDAVAHNLPVALNPCLDREIELGDIRRLLLDSPARLVTLLGPGGIGKTRLALHAAGQMIDAFPGGRVVRYGVTPRSFLPTITRAPGGSDVIITVAGAGGCVTSVVSWTGGGAGCVSSVAGGSGAACSVGGGGAGVSATGSVGASEGRVATIAAACLER